MTPPRTRLAPLATLAALASLLVGGSRPASALIPELSPADVQQALAMGTRGIAEADFGEEWHLRLPDGGEITVTTPFSRLARAARQAAFRGEPLTEEQQREQLDRSRGRLQLLVTMYGPVADFARWYQPVLEVGEREVKATFTQNERTGLRLADGRFRVRNIYVFRLEGLPSRGAVTLVVRSVADETEVLRAPLDLGKMR